MKTFRNESERHIILRAISAMRDSANIYYRDGDSEVMDYSHLPEKDDRRQILQAIFEHDYEKAADIAKRILAFYVEM